MMNPISRHPVIEKLHHAGRVHARHRAAIFLLRALKWTLIGIPVWMILDVLFHFSESLRFASLALFVAALLAGTIAACGIALFFRPPLLRIARLVESRNPSIGSKLVNFLQLEAQTRTPGSSDLTRSLANHAVEQAGSAIDARSLPRFAGNPRLKAIARHALIVPALLIVLTLVGGTHVRNEWLRFLNPSGDHPPFSLTRLAILSPKLTDTVLYDGSFLIQVAAKGHIPKNLFLTARPLEGDTPPVTLPMIPRGDGTFVVQLDNIRHPLQLTAHNRELTTRSHHRELKLILTPQIGAAFVRISPPAYTGQPSRELPFRFNSLQALEGSRISFRIQSNRPLGEGNLELLLDAENRRQFPLSPHPPATHEASSSFEAASSGKLSFTLVDTAGHTASVIPTSILTVTRDQPPQIAITAPDQDAFIVDHLTLPVTVDASDDYGLRSVRLHLLANGKPVATIPSTFDGPDTRRHQLVHPVDLVKAGVKAGDEITLFAEAIDTRPDPQLTRTNVRRLGVITEEQYNDFLRKQADVAMIAGKYEDLHDRFNQQIEAQRRLVGEREKLAEKARQNPDDPSLAAELEKSAEKQKEINSALESLAAEMNDFGRENPVYDFEKSLQQHLKDQAAQLRDAISENSADEQAAGGSPQPILDSAQAHRDRLDGGGAQMEKDIIEPLEELALLHELIKDFNQFRQLTEQQKEIAEQTKAYESKEQLTPDDRLALRALGDTQRQQARQLEALSEKLRHDAAQAKEHFPEASASAEELASQIGRQSMSSLARSAARQMLGPDAANSHPPARQLFEKMDALFCDSCQQGQQGAQSGLDRALSLSRGMQPGNSFQQMMQSLNFHPPTADGGSGSGNSGMTAMSASQGNPRVIGGESLMNGPISRSVSGPGNQGGAGTAGAPTAKIDRPDASERARDSSRRTSTPGSSSILLEYENIADAYFRRLTTAP